MPMIRWPFNKRTKNLELAGQVLNQTLKEYNKELTERAARVALAIQASGQEEVHEDFQWILKLIPKEIRGAKE